MRRDPAVWRTVLGTALLYVAALFVAATWVPVWHEWDWSAYHWMLAHRAPTLSQNVRFVDVTTYAPGHTDELRRTLTRILESLRDPERKPNTVVLDFDFGRRSGASAQTNALFSRALDDASGSYRVVAALNPADRDARTIDARFLSDRDLQTVYSRVERGHTIMKPLDSGNGIFYDSCYTFPAMRVIALPLVVSGAENPCDEPHHAIPYAGPLRGGDALTADTASIGGRTKALYLVLGTRTHDAGKVTGISNPELLTWAISDALKYVDANPLDQPLRLYSFVAGATTATIVAYFAIFHWARRWKLRGARPALPWIAAGVATIVAAALLAAVEALMFTFGILQPQIGLAAIAILAAAVLCGVVGAAIIRSAPLTEGPGQHDWDVFISYARRDADWVQANLRAPLEAAGLTVFFDKTSIHSGEDWHGKLVIAIAHSRCVVPVYSSEYFDSKLCKYELSLALRKWVDRDMDEKFVRAMMLREVDIPEKYRPINATRVFERPEAVAEIVGSIVADAAQQTERERVEA